MLLRLVVIEGPRQGEEIILRDAIVIGRKDADLNLSDSKVSSRHAQISENKDGALIIEDLGSSNGTYVNDVKITTKELKIGDRISIGKTVFRCEEEEPSRQEALGQGSWQDIVEESFTEALKNFRKNQGKAPQLGPYVFPLRLDFVKGVQSGTSITFGFGPRRLGRLCPDGLLLDPAAPDMAFDLYPSQIGICEIRTQFKDLKINDKTFTASGPKEFREKLRNGDRISFGQTVIVVKALKEV